ncbi:unnamed protein product [Brassica oleracea var. botrytis]
MKIGHRLVKIFKWIIQSTRERIQTGTRQCLTGLLNPVPKICSLARCLLE